MKTLESLPHDGDGSPSLVTQAVRAWDRFWFSPMDPTTLCMIRFLCGMLTFYVHVTYSWSLFEYIGPEAWVDHDLARYVRREMPQYSLGAGWDDPTTPLTKGNYYWSVFFHVTDPGWIIAIHIGFLTAMLMFALGLGTRWTGIITWIGAMSYAQRASTTVFGLDTMMMILLLYLQIGPSGATLSLDRWLQRWRDRRAGRITPDVQPSLVANFATRLIQVHFCVIYLAGGTSKLLGSTWWGGTALNLVVLNSSFAPMDNPLYFETMKFLASHRWLWEVVMTGGVVYTLCLEIGFPFLVWNPRWRWACVCGSIMLHAGIGLFMGLVTFSMMMMIMVSSFVPPDVIKQAVAALSDKLGGLLSAKRVPAESPLVMAR